MPTRAASGLRAPMIANGRNGWLRTYASATWVAETPRRAPSSRARSRRARLSGVSYVATMCADAVAGSHPSLSRCWTARTTRTAEPLPSLHTTRASPRPTHRRTRAMAATLSEPRVRSTGCSRRTESAGSRPPTHSPLPVGADPTSDDVLVERIDDLADRHTRVIAVEQVDVRRTAESFEAQCKVGSDRRGINAAVPLGIRVPTLGQDDDPIPGAAVCDPRPQHLLRLAAGVTDRAVDEILAGVHPGVEDGERLVPRASRNRVVPRPTRDTSRPSGANHCFTDWGGRGAGTPSVP